MRLAKTVTQEDMSLYSGPGNIHSDLEVAKRIGLDATIAQGVMTLAFASELMTSIHGEVWLGAGEISVKFTKPVFAGDTVTITAAETADGHAVEARNQDDELIMVGRARLR